MQSKGKIWVALAVILLGCAAAWLFRRTDAPGKPLAEKSGDEIVLREKDGDITNAPSTAGAASYLLGKIDSLWPAKSTERPTVGQNNATPEDPAVGATPTTDVPKPRLSAKPPWGSTNVVSKPRWSKESPSESMPNESIQTVRPASRPKRRTHKIVDGDTLSILAARYLGAANRYLEIFEANRQLLPGPDILPIGVELNIPPKSLVSTTPKARAAPQTRPSVSTNGPRSQRLLSNNAGGPVPSLNVGHSKPKATSSQPPSRPLVPVPPPKTTTGNRPS